MFAILFLLLDRCTEEFSDPQVQRACQLWKHNWLWNHLPTHEKYFQDLHEYNEKLSDQTGYRVTSEEGSDMIDRFLDIEFDAYTNLLFNFTSIREEINEIQKKTDSIINGTYITIGCSVFNVVAFIIIFVIILIKLLCCCICIKGNHKKMD